MAERGPLAAWRHFLALPVDSRPKTVLVAFAVSTVCAVAVTTATAILRPIQTANQAAEERLSLEALLATIPGMEAVLGADPDAALSTLVVDLEASASTPELRADDLAAALEDPANWTDLPPAADTAGIGARPDLAQVFLRREEGRVSLVVLPVRGAGYGGPIEAMLALRGDLDTIAGLTITDHSETPGLGARIEEPSWQARFAGKRLRDAEGEMRFAVVKDGADTEYEVDGITGATRTSDAVEDMIRFWTGPDGFGPWLDALRAEGG